MCKIIFFRKATSAVFLSSALSDKFLEILTRIGPKFHSCGNQSIDLHLKSIDWFLYEFNIGLICLKLKVCSASKKFYLGLLFNPFMRNVKKVGKRTLKILRCSLRMIFKVRLTIFNIMHERVNSSRNLLAQS